MHEGLDGGAREELGAREGKLAGEGMEAEEGQEPGEGLGAGKEHDGDLRLDASIKDLELLVEG